nr:hypothetical protein [Tanacetum cinerariifolium]
MLANSKLPTTFWAEAVNTACYVQNRVLVVKPHFKTSYELFKGRSLALSFMRPFGCYVLILNTLDQLRKFDGKSDEGIFVGYSTTSKAFRVYNIRTRKVEENLHINFLENKPMIAGGGPEWLFDIDVLSKSMNYASVSTGTNSNDFADNSLFDSSSQASDDHNKDKHGPSQASESDNQERPNAESGTKIVNTIGLVNTVTPTYADYPNDPLMPDLEDAEIFDDAYDNSDEGAEADYNNFETVISVSPIPSTKIHKDHPKEHIIRESSYKVEKALYGLHQAPRAWYETLSTYLLDNGFKRGTIDKTLFIKKIKDDILLIQVSVDDIIFGSTKSVKSATTPMETHKPLLKDANGTDVDVHLYRSMIGSLMYLTSSRQDIMFAVCACSRFQVQPKVSHMPAVKRIFRYLKGQPTLGLWYPKDSPLELIASTDSDYVASTDSDYVGANLDKKIYNRRLSVLWLQNQLLDYGYKFTQTKIHVDNESAICVVKNHVYHSKTKHIEIRHHFIRDSYEKRLIEMVKIHTDYNVADLLTKAFDVIRLIEMVKIHTDYNVADLLTKAFDVIRFVQLIINHQLGDITHRKDIFDTPSLTKKVFANMKRVGTGFFEEVTQLFDNMLVPAPKEVSILQADAQPIPIPTGPSTSKPRRNTNQKGSTPKNLRFLLLNLKLNTIPSPSHDPLPSGEDSLKIKELIDLCTNLSNKVLDLKSGVIDIKSTYKAKIEKLESRVERLEKENRVLKELKGVHSDEPVMEKKKSSKHGRKIEDINANVLSMLDVNDEELVGVEEVLKVVKAAKLITEVATNDGVDVNAASIQDTPITAAEVTKVIVEVPKPRKRIGVIIQDPEEKTTTVTVKPKVQAKDKGKAILIEEPKPLKRQVQIDLDEEVARQLEVEFNADIN